MLAFGVTVYLARVLGVEGYGIIAFSLSIILYLQKFVDFGVEAIGIRQVAADPSSTDEIAGTYLAGRLALACVVAALTSGLAAWLLPAPEGPILALYCLTLVTVALSTRWVHLGRERAASVSQARIAGEAAVLGLILATVRGIDRIALVPLAQFIGDSLAVVWLWVRLRFYNLKIRLRWDGIRLRAAIPRAWPLVGHSLLGLVIYNSDLVFLRIFRGRIDVGLYAAAYTLISFLLNLGWAYAESLLPTLTRLDSHGNGAARSLFETAQAQVFAVALPIAVGGSLVATPILVAVFGDQYAPAGAALALLIWSIPVSLFRSVAVAALISKDRNDLALRTTTGSVVVNLGLNVILIPILGVVGAALATLVTELMRGVLALNFARTLGYHAVAPRRLTRSAISALAMGSCVWLLSGGHLAAQVAAGVLVYSLAMILTGAVRVRGGLRLSV